MILFFKKHVEELQDKYVVKISLTFTLDIDS